MKFIQHYRRRSSEQSYQASFGQTIDYEIFKDFVVDIRTTDCEILSS